MRHGSRLWRRLLASHVAVVLVASATLFIAVGLAAPSAFEAAMGHAMGGMPGMGEMMDAVVRAAFRDAVQTALLLSIVVSVAAALALSVVLSRRLSQPIDRLAEAARRIASGRYAERVPVGSEDEIGELARSFNTMAGSLEATERRRLQLVGDVAHELRTPLATLDGYLEGLEDGVIAPSEATWSLLRGEATRLSRLVNDLQELWRAEARQLHLEPADLDAAEQLAAAADRFAAQAEERSIRLRVERSPGALRVRADAARLAQVLDNFLTNSVRLSPPGSTITLSVQWRPDGTGLCVTDEGPGLTGEQLELVFERFTRVDESRSRALGGAGIGLSIARALAETMGGRVEAHSAGPGRGATFSVVLPAS